MLTFLPSFHHVPTPLHPSIIILPSFLQHYPLPLFHPSLTSLLFHFSSFILPSSFFMYPSSPFIRHHLSSIHPYIIILYPSHLSFFIHPSIILFSSIHYHHPPSIHPSSFIHPSSSFSFHSLQLIHRESFCGIGTITFD